MLNMKRIRLLSWKRRILEVTAIVVAVTGGASAVGAIVLLLRGWLVWAGGLVIASFAGLILCHVVQALADATAWDIAAEIQIAETET